MPENTLQTTGPVNSPRFSAAKKDFFSRRTALDPPTACRHTLPDGQPPKSISSERGRPVWVKCSVMPSPFPGMDPYLEDPRLWPGVHARLLTAVCDQFQPILRPGGYFADIGEREWLTTVDRQAMPDVAVLHKPRREQPATSAVATLEPDEPLVLHAAEFEMRETFIEVFDAQGHRLVTSIEVVSPANKSNAEGRALYLKKQGELAAAGVNLVEIDLLREGPHVLRVPRSLVEAVKPWDYLVSVWRAPGKDYEVYPTRLRDRLPRIRVPLRTGDADAVLDLQAAFAHAYDTGPYPDRVDYNAEPTPPLSAEDQAWASDLRRNS